MLGALVFAKIILFITVLGLVVYLMHKLGVFEKIAEMFKEGKFDGVIKMFMLAFEGIKMIVIGIAEFIVAIFKVFNALFTGNGLGDALDNLLMKSLALIGKLITGTLMIAIGLLGGLMSFYVAIVIGGIEILWANIRSGLPTWMGGEGNAEERQAKREERSERKRGRRQAIGRGLMYGIEAMGSTPMVGMADGGLVASGGVFKVGERGEELVALPSGTKVFNNQQTRSMGNTINVSVNGRVGASEQELNDLARKLGEKINREMNRFGASGFRA